MPISTIGTYLPTIQQFTNHWTQVNVELAATPLILTGGYALANLQTERANLETAILAVTPADNVRANTATDRDIKKNAVRSRLAQFRALVPGVMAGSIYVRNVPKMPRFTINEAQYLQPFDDMANVWSQINAAPPPGFTAPLTLQGGYTQAAFVAELAVLRAAYIAAGNAIANARIARERRDLLLPGIRTRLQQYRTVARGRIPATSPLLNTIPVYSPAPGSTPAPVSVSGAWNAGTGKAVLTWLPSTNPALESYSVRTAPGSSYRTTDENSLVSLDKTVTTFATDAGLAVPGSVAVYRVYVVLTTGNEKGSATVKITRP